MKTSPRFHAALCFGMALAGATLFCLACAKNQTQSPTIAFSGSFVQRGRQVADLANYRIAYYEPVQGEDISGGGIQESDDPFVITDFGPRDELPQEIKKPSIYVVFSQPVVPLAKLGEPIRESAGLFEIEPPLAGVYRWHGSRLLSFEPDADSMPQQRYTITVCEGIASLGGKVLEGERAFSFETERLSVLDWQLGDGERDVNNRNAHPQDAQIIRLIFSYPVNLDEIANWIEIRAAGKTWPFTLARLPKIDERCYRAEQGVLVSIGGNLPRDTDVVMELKEGARSEPDWLGTKEAKTWSYHTLLPFSFERASTQSYSRFRGMDDDSIHISLVFSQDVEADGVERHFSVAGFPALKKENVNVNGRVVVINRLPLEYEKTYTVRIAAGLKDLFGRTLGRAAQSEVNTGEAVSYVGIRDRGPKMLEAGLPPRITWLAQNPVSLQRLVAAAQGPYERLLPNGLVRMDTSKWIFEEDLSPFLNAAGKGSAALCWEYQTKSSQNQIDSASAWLTVQVTNLGITLRYGYNTVLVWATHLSDGTAAANVAVELMEGTEINFDDLRKKRW
ncbi:MAG: hypothetical protein LBQ69_00730 [Treponema sp.]|jgi:hypothetical protein|nr:hypothetical protein [Treponema sp.]